MDYSYHGEPLIYYLKQFPQINNPRKELMQIVRYAYLNIGKITFEQAVDNYLSKNYGIGESGEINPVRVTNEIGSGKVNKSKNVIPSYLKSANLKFHGMSLMDYIKTNCAHKFLDKDEFSGCIRSIQHFLVKRQTKEENVEADLELYFDEQFEKFLHTYFVNHLKYRGIGMNNIVKYYLELVGEKPTKDRIFYNKNKLVKFIAGYYDEKNKKLGDSIDTLIELFILKEFNANLKEDILSIISNSNKPKTR